MDSKDGKKKESIDDILSDLNGLLNKMPSILDGIRLPEMRPVEFTKKELPPSEKTPGAAQQPVAGPLSGEADKTVVLPAFSGLPEGADVPGEKLPEPVSAAEAEPVPPLAPAPEPADAEKTVVLEPFGGLKEGDAAPAPASAAMEPSASQEDVSSQEKLVAQSLGDFMFGESAVENLERPAAAGPLKLAGVPLEPPADTAVPAKRSDAEMKPSLSVSELTPPAAEEEARLEPQAAAGPQPVPDMTAQPEVPAPPREEASLRPAAEPPGPRKIYDSTHDFGVPDIDTLLQMSKTERPAQDMPEAGLDRNPGQETGTQNDGPSTDELADFERQLKAAAPQGDIVASNGNDEEKNSGGALPPEAGFDGLIIEPEIQADQGVQDPGETLKLEAAGEPGQAAEPPVEPQAGSGPGTELPPLGQPEPQAGEPRIEKGPGIELSLGGQSELAPELPAPDAGAAVNADGPADNTQEFQPPPPAPAQEAGGAMVIETAGDVFSNPAGAEEETLVVAPPAAGSGEEEKTVIFEVDSVPGTTIRANEGDLGGLSAKAAPEGIPPERIRAVMFLYAPEDKALCATVLAELDAICLKSATKPMFIKRAAIKECESDINANFVVQSAADAGAVGLVCVGNVPQEKIYEIENAFASSGGFFRHYDASSFTHSAALDLVTDLILR